MSKMFIAAIAALALVAVSCGNRPGSPAAVCENGRFIGTVEDNGVIVFRGVPYAKAPVGDLRWKAPQPSFLTVGAGVKFSGVHLDFAYHLANEVLGGTFNIGLGYAF